MQEKELRVAGNINFKMVSSSMTGTTKRSWKSASVTHPHEYVGCSEIIEINENAERHTKGGRS